MLWRSEPRFDDRVRARRRGGREAVPPPARPRHSVASVACEACEQLRAVREQDRLGVRRDGFARRPRRSLEQPRQRVDERALPFRRRARLRRVELEPPGERIGEPPDAEHRRRRQPARPQLGVAELAGETRACRRRIDVDAAKADSLDGGGLGHRPPPNRPKIDVILVSSDTGFAMTAGIIRIGCVRRLFARRSGCVGLTVA